MHPILATKGPPTLLWAPAPRASRPAVHAAPAGGVSQQGFGADGAPAAPLVLSAYRVVLVSPKTAANLGAVLRVAENFEALDVWVVDPRCDPSDFAVGQVSHGSAAAASLVVAPTLAAALAGTQGECAQREGGGLGWNAVSHRQPAINLGHYFCTASAGSVGFTRRAGAGRVLHPSLLALRGAFPAALPLEAAAAAAAGEPPPPPVALVFGREESGLLEEELLLCAHACAIPSGRSQPSLNLSHAAAVVLSQLFEAALEVGLGGPDAFDSGESGSAAASQLLWDTPASLSRNRSCNIIHTITAGRERCCSV